MGNGTGRHTDSGFGVGLGFSGLKGPEPHRLHGPPPCTHSGGVSCPSVHRDRSRGSHGAKSEDQEHRRISIRVQTCQEPHPRSPHLPQGSHLIANDIDLVLDLGYPLAHNGKQFWDGGLGVEQNLLACRIIGVEEGKGWDGERFKGYSGMLTPHPLFYYETREILEPEL